MVFFPKYQTARPEAALGLINSIVSGGTQAIKGIKNGINALESKVIRAIQKKERATAQPSPDIKDPIPELSPYNILFNLNNPLPKDQDLHRIPTQYGPDLTDVPPLPIPSYGPSHPKVFVESLNKTFDDIAMATLDNKQVATKVIDATGTQRTEVSAADQVFGQIFAEGINLDFSKASGRRTSNFDMSAHHTDYQYAESKNSEYLIKQSMKRDMPTGGNVTPEQLPAIKIQAQVERIKEVVIACEIEDPCAPDPIYPSGPRHIYKHSTTQETSSVNPTGISEIQPASPRVSFAEREAQRGYNDCSDGIFR